MSRLLVAIVAGALALAGFVTGAAEAQKRRPAAVKAKRKAPSTAKLKERQKEIKSQLAFVRTSANASLKRDRQNDREVNAAVGQLFGDKQPTGKGAMVSWYRVVKELKATLALKAEQLRVYGRGSYVYVDIAETRNGATLMLDSRGKLLWGVRDPSVKIGERYRIIDSVRHSVTGLTVDALLDGIEHATSSDKQLSYR